MGLFIPVILGSVRPERQGIKAAQYIIRALTSRGHEPVLVDPKEKQLPLLERRYKEYPRGEAPPVLEELATLFRGADGFVVVTAEYNNSVPPALKNLLDHFLEEYYWRPSAIVSPSSGRAQNNPCRVGNAKCAVGAFDSDNPDRTHRRWTS